MIYRIDNVFDNERRKDILERSKKYLKSQEDFDVKFLPGKQTSPRLHTQISFATEVLQSIKDAVGLDLDIKKRFRQFFTKASLVVFSYGIFFNIVTFI